MRKRTASGFRLLGMVAAVAVLTLAAAHCAREALAQPDEAELLAIIEAPTGRHFVATKRHFAVILRDFAGTCPQNPERSASFADMLVATHNLLREGGLDRQEGLLSMSTTLHGLTMESAALAAAHGFPPPLCSQLWVMYTGLRRMGQAPQSARRDLVDVVAGLYREAAK